MDGISQRIATLEAWMNENAPYADVEQKHLDENSLERAYWNYGYLVALRAVKRMLSASPFSERKP